MPDLLNLEADVDRMAAELAHAQDVWEDRVRAGDEDAATLLWVAGQITILKGGIREFRARLPSTLAGEKAAKG